MVKQESQAKAFSRKIEVRFVDMDPLGHVNNSVYLSYMEQCRVGWFYEIELVKAGQRNAVPLILARAETDYLKPIADLSYLDTTMWISRIGTKSFDISYLISQNGEDKAKGTTTMVCYDYTKNASVAIWPSLESSLKEYYQQR